MTSRTPRLIHSLPHARAQSLYLNRFSHSPAAFLSGTSASPVAGPSRIPLVPRSQFPSRSASTFTTPSSSASSPVPPLPSRPKISITPPSLEAIKEDAFLDDDVELIPPGNAMLIITPEAVTQLASITAREPPDILEKGKLALRVGVESGGCHGYQYTMAITEERGADDYVFQPEGVRCIPVIVDIVSLGLLKGSTIHHATELIGSSFRIQDNPQAKAGGACGCGVSWEANV